MRKAAGFEFAGTEPEATGYVAQCELDKPELLKPGFNPTEGGLYIYPPHFGTLYAIDFDGGKGSTQPATHESFEEVLRRVSGTAVSVTKMHNVTTFTDRCKQVTQYRRGQVLLAGDSAHIHPPLGAQGLNCGIGDALNLGWKLAATIKGTAAPGLLDTYHTERHPIGEWVLDWNRAQIATLRPGPSGQAMQKLMRKLIDTEDGTTFFVGSVWGLDLQYDLDVKNPLVGRSAPDLELEDGTRLGSKLTKGRWTVVDLQGTPEVQDHAASLGVGLEYISIAAKESLGLKVLLLRPDGFVAWAAEDEVDSDSLTTAVSHWLRAAGIKT